MSSCIHQKRGEMSEVEKNSVKVAKNCCQRNKNSRHTIALTLLSVDFSYEFCVFYDRVSGCVCFGKRIMEKDGNGFYHEQ